MAKAAFKVSQLQHVHDCKMRSGHAVICQPVHDVCMSRFAFTLHDQASVATFHPSSRCTHVLPDMNTLIVLATIPNSRPCVHRLDTHDASHLLHITLEQGMILHMRTQHARLDAKWQNGPSNNG